MENQYLAAFSEIEVQEVNYIRFLLPELDIGRNDIEISADYGQSRTAPDTITANIWARVGNSNLKGFLYSQPVSKSSVDANGYTEIVLAINQNPVFHERLQSFLAWADRNISK